MAAAKVRAPARVAPRAKAEAEGGGRPKTDAELLERAVELVRGGLTPTEASEELGGKVGKTRIYEELRRRAAAAVAEAAGEPPAPAPPAASPGAPPAAPAPQGGDEQLDELAVYDDLLRTTKIRLDTAEPQRFAALMRVYQGLLAERRALAPPKPKTDEELEQEARALADDVVRRFQQAVTDAETRAAAEGTCHHCGAALEDAAP